MKCFLYVYIFILSACNSQTQIELVDGSRSTQNAKSLVAKVGNSSKIEVFRSDGTPPDISNLVLIDGITRHELVLSSGSATTWSYLPNTTFEIELGKDYKLEYTESDEVKVMNFNLEIPSSIPISKIASGSENTMIVSSNSTTKFWNDYWITQDTIINVPADYATFSEAFDYLLTKRIRPDAIVTIQLADGTHNYIGTTYLNHPDGDQVKIIGNTTTPSNVILQSVSSGALTLNNSSHIGEIDGVTIQGTNTSGISGLIVYQNSVVSLGSNMIIKNFDYGLTVQSNAYAEANNLSLENNLTYGAYALNGGYLYLPNSNVTGNGYGGFFIGSNSSADYDNSTFTGNSTWSVQGWVGGYLGGFGASYAKGSSLGYNSTGNN